MSMSSPAMSPMRRWRSRGAHAAAPAISRRRATSSALYSQRSTPTRSVRSCVATSASSTRRASGSMSNELSIQSRVWWNRALSRNPQRHVSEKRSSSGEPPTKWP